MRVVWFQLLLHYLVTSEFKWRPVMLCSAINACHVRFSETRYALFGSRGAYRDLSERCCCLQVVCFPRDDRAVFEKKEKRQKENENKEKTPTFAIMKRGRDTKCTVCKMKDLLTSRKFLVVNMICLKSQELLPARLLFSGSGKDTGGVVPAVFIPEVLVWVSIIPRSVAQLSLGALQVNRILTS